MAADDMYFSLPHDYPPMYMNPPYLPLYSAQPQIEQPILPEYNLQYSQLSSTPSLYPLKREICESHVHQEIPAKRQNIKSESHSKQDSLTLPDSIPKSFQTVAEQFLAIEFNLAAALLTLEYGDKVSHIYNPVDYAIEPHANYIHKFCNSRKSVLFLGMNPGPFGMAQTGVPFGEASIVREWLQIEGYVRQPEKEHPKRPVWGLDCPRKEVSGARFWGFLKEKCGSPYVFFQHCFVHNMCPLVFMAPTGKNLTPPDLPAAARRPLNTLCDQALCKVIKLLGIQTIVGIGKYAEGRAIEALKDSGINSVTVYSIMHPSPANPAANKGWSGIVERQLSDIGIMQMFPVRAEPCPSTVVKEEALNVKQ